MKIRMLTDAPGSPDGVTVEQYAKGDTYNVPDELGDTFLKYGLAEKPKTVVGRTKKVSGPAENK